MRDRLTQTWDRLSQLRDRLIAVFFERVDAKQAKIAKDLTTPPNLLKCRCVKGLRCVECCSNTPPTLHTHSPLKTVLRIAFLKFSMRPLSSWYAKLALLYWFVNEERQGMSRWSLGGVLKQHSTPLKHLCRQAFREICVECGVLNKTVRIGNTSSFLVHFSCWSMLSPNCLWTKIILKMLGYYKDKWYLCSGMCVVRVPIACLMRASTTE